MGINVVTKIALVLATFFLAVIAFSCVLNPDAATADRGSSFELQLWSFGESLPGLPSQSGYLILFDAKDGSIWAYSEGALLGSERPIHYGKLTKLGEPVQK